MQVILKTGNFSVILYDEELKKFILKVDYDDAEYIFTHHHAVNDEFNIIEKKYRILHKYNR